MMLGCLSVLCITSAYCFFNDTATTEIYTYLHTLSLHDALPISSDCNYDLALLRWGAGALIEGHHALGTTHPTLAKWRDIAARLTPYPVDEHGYRIGADRAVQPHRHYSHLMMIYPVYLENRDTPAKLPLPAT